MLRLQLQSSDLSLHRLSRLTTAIEAPGNAEDPWREVLSAIRTSLSPHEFETWFAPARFVGTENDVVVIRVPNAMFANHLEGEYRDRILSAFAAAGSPVASIRCSVAASPAAARGRTAFPAEGAHATPGIAGGLAAEDDVPTGAPGAGSSESARPILRSDSVSASFSFDSFVVGASNRFAHSAALDVSNPGVHNSPYNPLLIYGEAGLGKTHLLQAIARRFVEQNPGQTILLTRGDTFSSHVISAVRSNDLYGFRTECARLDMLLVDNIQFIAGLDRFGRVAEEFFHALTALSDRGRPIVLTSDRDPRDIPNLDGQIKSRLESGLATDIGSPDWKMRTAIVRKKAATLGLELPDGVAETIASRHQNNVRRLEGTLNKLVAESNADRVRISPTLLDRVLSDRASRRSRSPSIQEVQVAVAKAFGFAPLRLVGKQRSNVLVLARHVAMYLCRKTTGRTLVEIGKEFRRDHSTVTYGVRRIAAARKRDLGLNKLIERLLDQLS
ncbi:MAG: chromosomal replication initiator protein DnaA [Acidobacteria bacterium]|nr:chromosomal replication initiator protein DnaA [Acidobacteriota bacterium]